MIISFQKEKLKVINFNELLSLACLSIVLLLLNCNVIVPKTLIIHALYSLHIFLSYVIIII